METNNRPLRLFISYSHQDELFLNELEKHLVNLQRENLLETWHDRKIIPGSAWEDEIGEALNEAEIFVFLISPDFVASEYCFTKELTIALEKQGRGEAVIIPIIVRPSDWGSTPIGKIQSLPKNADPISIRKDRDQAWLEVVQGIRRVISDLLERQTNLSPKVRFSGIGEVLTSVVERLEIRYNLTDTPEKNIGGISTGLLDLDAVIDGIHPGDLICVAAAPVMDRMALLAAIMNNVFVDRPNSGLVFTLRQTQEQVVQRMCAALGRISVRALQRGELEDEDWSSLTHALALLNDTKINFVEQPSIDIDSLISKIDKYIELNGFCSLVVIDQFEHVVGDSRSNLLAKLGRYARAHDVAIIVSTGLETDPSSRPNKRPVLKDIGEWAPLNEDLDVVIFVYQEAQYDPDSPNNELAELIVAKNSRGSLGTVSAVRLRKGQAFVDYRKTNQS